MCKKKKKKSATLLIINISVYTSGGFCVDRLKGELKHTALHNSLEMVTRSEELE